MISEFCGYKGSIRSMKVQTTLQKVSQLQDNAQNMIQHAYPMWDSNPSMRMAQDTANLKLCHYRNMFKLENLSLVCACWP
jgi:hypothetical protein